MNDGWTVLERRPDGVLLTHPAPPPAWWILWVWLPLATVLGLSSGSDEVVTLTVSFDDEGRLVRRISGALAPAQRRRSSWLVADGPEPPDRK